ncbi:MAG TPA: adenylate/guanylate cyclase domain-containing protein [Myxococcales bacterium]|nr:adenylate/guanylate cyclase domain-containing protein [Myxococcales bacterium]
MSIRAKLFALLLGLGAAAAGLGLLTAWLNARAAVREQAERDFARIGSAWHAALAERLQQLGEDVTSLSGDVRYSSCMSQASADPDDFAGTPGDVRAANLCLCQQALHTRWGRTFVLLNDQGLQIIRQDDEQDDIGHSFADRAIVQAALHRQTAFELDRAGDEIDVATPVVNPEGRLFGVAMAGLSTQAMFQSLGRELGVEIAIAPGAAPGPPHEVRAGGRTRLEQFSPLPGPKGAPALATVVLSRDLGATLAPFERAVRRGAALGGGAALLLAVLFALVAAGRATRPLEELSRASAAIAQGKYETRVAERGRDEIGRLARSFNAMAEGLGQRVFFESALRRYLAPAVVDDLVRDPSRMRLGGERREMTVLFFDVAGFTALAETLAPDELVALCNGYLEQVVGALFDAGGTLDKFIGDAVMALFGVPLAQPDHPARACRAALAMQRAFAAHVSASPNPAVRALHARIGLHSGTAAFGNLGARSIMSLTAMGDAVNLASRLEGVNKVYRTDVLASEATARAAGCATRELDLVKVVGRKEPVRIFEILADPAPPGEALAAYAAALTAYRERRFEAAAAGFDRAAALGDRPASVLAQRSREYRGAPPPEGWDGSFALDRK